MRSRTACGQGGARPAHGLPRDAARRCGVRTNLVYSDPNLKLRGLAVTSAARSEVLPDLPTVADFLPGYEASAWYGLGAPKGTPDEIIDKVNKAMNAILADPKSQARFRELGASLLPGSPADFGKLLAEETEKWGKVVRFSGAKPD